jgi:type III pantothenate kinase
MTPAVVADVGNTRIKWGLCSATAVTDTSSLPPDDPSAWQRQRERWGLTGPRPWVVTGVHPARRERLADWLRRQGDEVRVVDDPLRLPLRVLVARPDHVGIDRLLDGVAANSRRTPGRPAVVIDAGSAVTVDYLDDSGAFTGGAIAPGLRLMARALHDHTALLPVIEPPREVPALPGAATIPAMAAGIFWSVAGGVQAMLREYAARSVQPTEVFLTGGDASLLYPVLPGACHWPAMTLEGIRLTAEAMP